MSIEEQGSKGKHRDTQKDLRLLTPRELQVLKLIADGKSNKEIAWALKIGIDAVKLHVSHVLQKLDVSSRTQAAVIYVRSGWNARGEEPGAGGETGSENEEIKGA